jgi:hypothetical protein
MKRHQSSSTCILLLLFLFSLTGGVSSQTREVSFNLATTANGVLQSKRPQAITQDKYGFLWISFYGSGLDKFDPATGIFTHYRHDPKDKASLGSDIVSAVLVDHLGNVWVGSNGGLDLLDQKTGKFKNFKHHKNDSTSLSYDVVRAIYEDKSGELWVGIGTFFSHPKFGGLNRFHRNSGTFTRYLSDPANPQTLIDNRVKEKRRCYYAFFRNWHAKNA